MTTAAGPNITQDLDEVYDPDEVVPQNSPLFKATAVALRQSPEPSPPIPPPPKSNVVRPSLGDAVLVSFMDGGRRPDIATIAGTEVLAPDTSEESAHDNSKEEESDSEDGEQAADQEDNTAWDSVPSSTDALKSLAAGALKGLMSKDTGGGNDDGPTPPVDEPDPRLENGQGMESSQITLVRRDGMIRDDRAQPLAPSQPRSHVSYSSHQMGCMLANKHDPRAPTVSLTERGSLPPIHMSTRTDRNGPTLPSIRDQLGDFKQLELQSPAFLYYSPRVPKPLEDSSNLLSPNNHAVHQSSEDYSSSPTETPNTDHSRSTPTTSTSVADRMNLSGASFSNPEELGLHICKFPGCKAPPFQTQYLLNSHSNVHSSARPHYCPVKGCPRSEGGKGFKRKNEMIRHGLVHDSPGYVCPFCPDQEHKYPRPDNLQR